MQPNQHASNHPIRIRNTQRIHDVSEGTSKSDGDDGYVYEHSTKRAASARRLIEVRSGRKQERTEENALAYRR